MDFSGVNRIRWACVGKETDKEESQTKTHLTLSKDIERERAREEREGEK